ncbi:alpha/beta fold hydrolase [Indiicoccus explosivorum]|uniref:alpha/beta fold hydrolase n=1 Tax=Indiicoccus explosivorum TaxID=1917864 RepID=UPI000B44A3BF|nr:alpha/beta hydrolase [Indiicoccus explosivorum]
MDFYKVNVNGHDIQVADYPGDGETIIAIHGLTGTHRNMHHYAQRYKGRFRVIAVDLRGRGNSSGLDAEPSIFKHAEDIIGLIGKFGIRQPILIGHSMGAFISAIVASRLQSVQAVILLDGAAQMSEHQQAIVKPSLARLSKQYRSKADYVDEIKTIYSGLGISWNETLQETVEYEVGQTGGHWENKSEEAGILADFDSFYQFVPKEICPDIRCPVLLVYAKGNIGPMPPLFYLDDYADTQKFTEDLTVTVSDSNHYTMVFEERQEIFGAIDAFLAKTEQA